MKVGKKFLMLILLSAAFLMVAGRANAKLLGLTAGAEPDIYINGNLQETYTVSGAVGTLTVIGHDEKFYTDKSTNSYYDMDSNALFTLTVLLDSATGAFISGTMTEIVIAGESVTIGTDTYGAGTNLLSGTVSNFGWGDQGTMASVDALIDPDMSSALIVDGYWPVGPDAADPYPIAIVALGDTADNWASVGDEWYKTSDTIADLKVADKFPTPEPSTILLLGLGLLGLAGITVKRNRG